MNNEWENLPAMTVLMHSYNNDMAEVLQREKPIHYIYMSNFT